jgi:Ran-binding protein 1
MHVRLAALRCASKVVAAASFPRTDRLAMMDVLVRCLRDMREEAQAAAGPHPGKPREDDYSDEFEAVATLWRFDEGEDRWTGGANGTVKVLTHRSLAGNLLFIFRYDDDDDDDANGKLMAYHPFTSDTQLVKVDDVTWEWRAEKDYADDDEGFAEQFRLSLQSSERASRFQHYVARSNRQFTPAPGTSAPPPPPGVAVEDEFVAAAQKAFGSYSVARRQTFVDAVLRAAIHGPAKNVKRPTNDDRSSVDDEYHLAALTALRTWCESDVTSEPVACCPAAQRLVDNGGAMEAALLAIAGYDPIAHEVCSLWAGCAVMNAGYRLMTTLQKHVRPDAIRGALGEDVYTSFAALVTLLRKFTPDRVP